MNFLKKNPWTTVGGIIVVAGYAVGMFVDPSIGRFLEMAGTAVIGWSAKDGEKSG